MREVYNERISLQNGIWTHQHSNKEAADIIPEGWLTSVLLRVAGNNLQQQRFKKDTANDDNGSAVTHISIRRERGTKRAITMIIMKACNNNMRKRNNICN